MTKMLDLRVLAPGGLFYFKLVHDCLVLFPQFFKLPQVWLKANIN